MADRIESYDCEGCSGHCYGGYHMEVSEGHYGDWVRKEDVHKRAQACLAILLDHAQPHLAVRMKDACKYLDVLLKELSDG